MRNWWTLAGTSAGLFVLMLDSTVVALARSSPGPSYATRTGRAPIRPSSANRDLRSSSTTATTAGSTFE
jgi:hypothetical protein